MPVRLSEYCPAAKPLESVAIWVDEVTAKCEQPQAQNPARNSAINFLIMFPLPLQLALQDFDFYSFIDLLSDYFNFFQ
jgi:hypothetical protein